MRIFRYVHFKAAVPLIFVIALAVGVSACTIASAADSKEFKAEVTTGVNRLYGEPLLEFEFMPSPFKERFGFETMGVSNPDGTASLLTPETPDNAVLVSLVDPDGVGLPPPLFKMADPALSNIPLRDIQTWVLPPDLNGRTALQPHLSGPVIGPTQAEPTDTITKGDWLKASGKMNVKCGPNGNRVTIRAKDLVPHRLYTVWSIWLDPAEGGSVTPLPLGGAPNSFITDEKGNATFERDLNFCPLDAARDGINGKKLGIIDAHLHSDHVAYGAIPAPFAAGFPPGAVIHEHLSWNVGAGQHR